MVDGSRLLVVLLAAICALAPRPGQARFEQRVYRITAGSGNGAFEVGLDNIQAARRRLHSAGLTDQPSSLSWNRRLSQLGGLPIYCALDLGGKHGSDGPGSFKIRGVVNAIAEKIEDNPAAFANGVFAVSAGNHAKALALVAKKLGIRATIVMPIHAVTRKIEDTGNLGATVVLEGETYAGAKEHALLLARRQGGVFIDGFADPAVIAGQGGAGLDLVSGLRDMYGGGWSEGLVVAVPLGGGGLAAGVAEAVMGQARKEGVIEPSVWGKVWGRV